MIEITRSIPSELAWKRLSRAITLTRTPPMPTLGGSCQA